MRTQAQRAANPPLTRAIQEKSGMNSSIQPRILLSIGTSVAAGKQFSHVNGMLRISTIGRSVRRPG